jgi:hypothetical protein
MLFGENLNSVKLFWVLLHLLASLFYLPQGPFVLFPYPYPTLTRHQNILSHPITRTTRLVSINVWSSNLTRPTTLTLPILVYPNLT